MKKQFITILFVVLNAFAYSNNFNTTNPPPPELDLENCTFKGYPLTANVEIVDGFEDFSVEIVDGFEDVKIKVSNFLIKQNIDPCPTWHFVAGFGDYKIRIVDGFADLKVRLVY